MNISEWFWSEQCKIEYFHQNPFENFCTWCISTLKSNYLNLGILERNHLLLVSTMTSIVYKMIY